jgi:isopenicillin N synthase-like dioxygenase
MQSQSLLISSHPPFASTDKWISTLHRVVVPNSKDEVLSENRRQSIAFFVNINGDAIVETIPSCVHEGNPIRYEPIQAGQYVLEKYLKSMGMQ